MFRACCQALANKCVYRRWIDYFIIKRQTLATETQENMRQRSELESYREMKLQNLLFCNKILNSVGFNSQVYGTKVTGVCKCGEPEIDLWHQSRITRSNVAKHAISDACGDLYGDLFYKPWKCVFSVSLSLWTIVLYINTTINSELCFSFWTGSTIYLQLVWSAPTLFSSSACLPCSRFLFVSSSPLCVPLLLHFLSLLLQ